MQEIINFFLTQKRESSKLLWTFSKDKQTEPHKLINKITLEDEIQNVIAEGAIILKISSSFNEKCWVPALEFSYEIDRSKPNIALFD